MKILFAIDRVFEKLENLFVVSLFSFLLILAFIQILLRFFFSTGLFFANEFIQNAVFWVGFAGASLATKQRRHINIDIFSRLLKPRMKKGADILLDLAASFISILLLYASYKFICMEYEYRSASSSLGIPVWCLELILPILFSIMSFRFFIGAINNTIGMIKGERGEVRS